jgi:hypothetical protein
LGGATDDRAIIRQLPVFLSDTARAWLEDLPLGQIHNWNDLMRVFEGNFKGTYMCPGNSWDLRSCKQKPDESLRDYIRRFSKQRTELPNITDSDVIMAFLSGTTCKELVRELGRNTPVTANELMDITNYAAGEEVVGAIFGGDQDKGKRKDEEPEGSSRGTKRSNRKKKKISRASAKPRLTTLLPPLTARSLEDPLAGAFSTKCSKNRVPTTRDLRTTTSRTATCCGGTLKA